MQTVSRILSWLFGFALIGFSLFVTMETAARKLFNFSFQGADELGGYVLAIGGALSFTVALLERGHVRIDLLHDRLGPTPRAILNTLSYLAMGAFGLFVAWYGFGVVKDSYAYGSRAPTAWATPMIYPQSIWYAALLAFSAVSVALAGWATFLLLKGDIAGLNQRFDAKGTLDELDEELEDLKRR